MPRGVAIRPSNAPSMVKYMSSAHWGQKWKLVRLPLAPVTVQCFVSPSIVTFWTGQRAWTVKALPDRFLQLRQWQTDTRNGSAAIVSLTCPQRHEAVRMVTSPLSEARGERGRRAMLPGQAHPVRH